MFCMKRLETAEMLKVELVNPHIIVSLPLSPSLCSSLFPFVDLCVCILAQAA